MDSKRPTLKPTASAYRPQTAGSSSQGEEAGCHGCLHQLQSASTMGRHGLPLAVVQELGSKMHEAISQKNMNLLTHLVTYHKASLEERNKYGLTPLYYAVHCNWSDGALLLLKHGANVQNAESRPQNLCFFYKPLMHLALKTGSQPLVRALVKRGASIRVKDIEGKTCFSILQFSSVDVLFHCMANAVTEEGSSRTNLLKDLLFLVSSAVHIRLKHKEVEEFIGRLPCCHKNKMFQVFAACLCRTVWDGGDDNLALHYWRMSAKCMPCLLHDHTVEEEMAPKSVFADILDEKAHPLPDTVNTDNDSLAIHIRALFAIEKHMPDNHMFLQVGEFLYDLLLSQGKIVTAVGLLWRLTTVRVLVRIEVLKVRDLLRMSLDDEEDREELPVSAILDSMKTIENCASHLDANNSRAKLAHESSGDNSLNAALMSVFKALLQIMTYCCAHEVLETPEHLRDFTSHLKDFLHRFPSTYCQQAFHLLGQSNPYQPSTASIIKDLVACSAEVRGTIRQQNSPLHLLSDEDGNTPLHCIARHRSPEELVQEGVLQCFLDNGAHLCTRNYQGETVRSILVERGIFTEGEHFPSLQCLAAAAFMKEGRLWLTVKDCLPTAVRNFLLDH